MNEPALIGIDVGTSAVKGILMDLDGKVLATFARPYPTVRLHAGEVEQDPHDWLDGVLAALNTFAAATDRSRVTAIGLCSQVNTHAFVDAAGEALLPAMVWQDVRCCADAAELDARITPEQKTAWFGGPMPIDASHALARMTHVASRHADLYARCRWQLLPKDYCALALTGEVATDAISAVGLVDSKLAYIEELIALVPGARERLAPLADLTQSVGAMRRGLPFAGVPVFVGTMDSWASMLGVGVVADKDAMYVSGTSDVTGVVSSRHVPTTGVIVFPPCRGIMLHVAPTQSGGASLLWLSTLLGRSPDELSALAATIPACAAVPLFLPHLQGERAPVWDAKSRAVFARVETATGPGELTRAVLEGVAFSARLAFEASERSAGFDVDRLNIGGGGARSDVWCQIRADVLGKTLRRAAVRDAGTLGAAMIAGVGSGLMTSLKAAASQLVAFDRTFEPNAAAARAYEERFGKYQELYADLRPFNQGFG